MTHSCPIDELEDYLLSPSEAAIAPDRESALVAHLDSCRTCQQRVEQIAGSGDDWSAIGNALSSSGLTCDSYATYVDTPTLRNNDPGLTASKEAAIAMLLNVLSPTDHPESAGRIGGFEVVGLVGSGGNGMVLKARDPSLDRFVAIKVLAPHLASSQSARKRFAREAKAAAAVIHDNVIPIYQVSDWNDLPFLVMPFMPDPSLGQRIEKDGPLELEAAISIAMQIARGLSAAHSQGLVHRDVKPANVLLSKGTERAIITDFGLARTADDASLTRAGALAGTPHFMSPEQARGEQVDQKSDLFSLGSVLFVMLTGRPPVDRELGTETIRELANGKTPKLDSKGIFPEWIVRLVSWLHEEHRNRRPESAQQVATVLEQCLAHVRQPSKTPLPSELVSPPKRPIWQFGAIAAAVLLLVYVSQVVPPITGNHDAGNQDTDHSYSSSPLQHEPISPGGIIATAEEDDTSDLSASVDLAAEPQQQNFHTNQEQLLEWEFAGEEIDLLDLAIESIETDIHQ